MSYSLYRTDLREAREKRRLRVMQRNIAVNGLRSSIRALETLQEGDPDDFKELAHMRFDLLEMKAQIEAGAKDD